MNEPLDITIRKNYAQTKACFIVVRNLQAEVQNLTTRVDTLLRALRLTLEVPTAEKDRIEALTKRQYGTGDVDELNKGTEVTDHPNIRSKE